MVTQVSQIDEGDYLAQARRKVEKWQKRSKSHEFDFDAKLEEAKEQLKKDTSRAHQKIRMEHAKATMDIYALRCNMGAAGRGDING